MNGTKNHIVITVHGIRTYGQWQERLEALVKKEAGATYVYNYKYGYFSILAFLVPFTRWLITRRFRQWLVNLLKQYPRDSRLDIVAHSFGTHLVGWGLHGIPKTARPRLHTLILAGSVLKTAFRWDDLMDDKTVTRLVNDCGVH